jgi:serine/threonine protein kinase
VTNEGSGDFPDATLREFTKGQKLFGRFTLTKILGRGGMGVVWLARDVELEREVALKFLPDVIVHDRSLLVELKRETRRSLELTHKNIVRIHDFVFDERSACISMEYVDGDTLANLRSEKERKVFEPNEIAPWISQLCDALDYAHNQARIVHRDLKPANLMVSQKGDLKISDFGIARSLGDSVSRLTMEQGRSGTLVYMSPQQLDGGRGSHLDDIYSLGATLYDLLTSKPPFYSGNLDRQIHDRAAPSMTERRRDLNIEPTSVPLIWEEVVAACLQKDPTKRPQSTAEIANRLQLSAPTAGWVRTISAGSTKKKALALSGVALLVIVATAGWYVSKLHTKPAAAITNALSQAAAIPEKSIAVLPFENLSAEKDDAFFADGIQDDVLTSLGKIKELTVIARASVLSYRGQAAAGKLREIGQTLRVSHILQGSVRRLANRVVVNVQLIDARNERQLWSERYDRTMSDMLSLQGELAVEIARELRATLSPAETSIVATKPTENPEAYVLYLRAREIETPRLGPTGEDWAAAAKLYQQAIELDPKFALARARLSLTMSYTASTEAEFQKALAQAEEALRLNPNLGEGRLALAAYHWEMGTWDAALAELVRAEELMPNSIEVWQIRASVYRRQEKLRERIAALQRAEVLDPRDANTRRILFGTFMAVRRWVDAIRTAEQIKALVPDHYGVELAAARAEFRRTGLLDPLKKIVSQPPSGSPPDRLNMTRYQIAMFERDYSAAEGYLRLIPAQKSEEPLAAHTKATNEALLAVARGADAATVENALLTARREVEQQIDDSAIPTKNGELGLIDAFRGRKEDAINEGRRFAEETKSDVLLRNQAAADLSLIYARTGETEEAIKLIEKLLTLPAEMNHWRVTSITLADLKWRWVWDPLRNNPRFQKILASPEPKTIY